jgi:hypothetical protein
MLTGQIRDTRVLKNLELPQILKHHALKQNKIEVERLVHQRKSTLHSNYMGWYKRRVKWYEVECTYDKQIHTSQPLQGFFEVGLVGGMQLKAPAVSLYYTLFHFWGWSISLELNRGH